MATVGNLNINVNARTARFNKKMKSVRATVSRLAAGFINIAKKAALFGIAMGTVAVVAIAAMTKKGLAAVDTMAKLAANIGASVASIQVLRHMATIGGVSIEKMDKSIAKMVKNVGESAMGIGTATDALKELRLNATDLEKMAPDEMFGVLADAINQLPTAARKASVAYDIMGRAGQELLVTMAGGSESIDEMRQKLDDLGIVVGDDQARMVEQANDAWADIGLVWRGLSEQLAVNFAPVLIEIADRIRTMIIEFGGMGQVAEFIVRSFFMAGAAILDMIKGVRIVWMGLIAGILQAIGDFYGAVAKILGDDSLAAETAKHFKDSAADIAGSMNDLITEGWSLQGIDKKIEDLRKKWSKPLEKPVEGVWEIEPVIGAAGGGGGPFSIETAHGAFKTGRASVMQTLAEEQNDLLTDIVDNTSDVGETMEELERRWDTEGGPSMVPDPNVITPGSFRREETFGPGKVWDPTEGGKFMTDTPSIMKDIEESMQEEVDNTAEIVRLLRRNGASGVLT